MNNMSEMLLLNFLYLDVNKMFKILNKGLNIDMGLKYVNRNICYVIRLNYEYKFINII